MLQSTAVNLRGLEVNLTQQLVEIHLRITKIKHTDDKGLEREREKRGREREREGEEREGGRERRKEGERERERERERGERREREVKIKMRSCQFWHKLYTSIVVHVNGQCTMIHLHCTCTTFQACCL